mmetsp:Transcript_31931/g.68812  ORF Transcript_31931/g.68812 Transcript_31931/m.68812 type:complete len:289 (+) Transcript_31931:893-1759(+)
MPGAVHPVVIGEISRCQDWIAIVGKEGASDFLADGDDHRMVHPSTTFRRHQVIGALVFVHMRTLHEDTSMDGATPQIVSISSEFPVFQVQLMAIDLAFPREVGLLGCCGAHVPNPPIVIEENVRIDAWGTLDDMRIRPRPSHISGGDDEVGARPFIRAHWPIDAGGDDVEGAILETDGRRLNPIVGLDVYEVYSTTHLLLSVQTMSRPAPVHQVVAFMDGQPREVLEGRVAEVEGVTDPTNGGIWKSSGQHGIHKGVLFARARRGTCATQTCSEHGGATVDGRKFGAT